MNNKLLYLSNTVFYMLFLSSLIAIILDYKNNIIYYLIYGISIFLSIILIIFSKKKLTITKNFLIIFSLLTVIYLNRYTIYNDVELQYTIVSFINILVGYSISLNLEKINFKFLLYFTNIFIIYFIVMIANNSLLLLGNTEYLNRTYYTLPSVLLLMITAYKDFVLFKKVDIFIIMLFLLVAILSFSRSSMLFPLLAVFLFFIIKKRILAIVIIIPLIIYLIINIDFTEINYLGDLITRIEERGLDSGRYEFWQDHISQINFTKFIIGYDFNEVHKTLSSYFEDPKSHTLHSSLLHIHIIYGVIGLIIFILYFYRQFSLIYTYKMSYYNKIIYTLIIFTFLSKILFETVLFVQRYDFIFYAILFHSGQYLKKRQY